MITKENAVSKICANCCECGHCEENCKDVQAIYNLPNVLIATADDITTVLTTIANLRKEIETLKIKNDALNDALDRKADMSFTIGCIEDIQNKAVIQKDYQDMVNAELRTNIDALYNDVEKLVENNA